MALPDIALPPSRRLIMNLLLTPTRHALARLQAARSDFTSCKLAIAAYEADCAQALGVDMTKYKLDITTGTFRDVTLISPITE